MSRNRNKKLTLARETLRQLDVRSLQTVVGGKKETKGKKCDPEPNPDPGGTVNDPCHTNAPGLCPTQLEDGCPSVTVDPFFAF
jgi:hypothetical protein